jgi:hypothetical protein
MIEVTLYNYLSGVLSAPVSLEVPANADTYVVFERTGGGAENHLLSATIAIQSVSTSMYNAIALNEEVKTAMEDIASVEDLGIYSCKLNSDYNYTDTTTKKYRYQAVFDLYYQED